MGPELSHFWHFPLWSVSKQIQIQGQGYRLKLICCFYELSCASVHVPILWIAEERSGSTKATLGMGPDGVGHHHACRASYHHYYHKVYVSILRKLQSKSSNISGAGKLVHLNHKSRKIISQTTYSFITIEKSQYKHLSHVWKRKREIENRKGALPPSWPEKAPSPTSIMTKPTKTKQAKWLLQLQMEKKRSLQMNEQQ